MIMGKVVNLSVAVPIRSGEPCSQSDLLESSSFLLLPPFHFLFVKENEGRRRKEEAEGLDS